MNQNDAAAEYEALTRSAGLIDLSSRGLLQLTGEDRVRFLNGQTTNDVSSLKPGHAVYTAFVTAKGKMRADGNILAFTDKLWIDVESKSIAKALAADLDKFIIADDVQVENLSDGIAQFTLAGPETPNFFKKIGMIIPEEINRFGEFGIKGFGSAILFRFFLGGDLAVRLLLPQPYAQTFVTSSIPVLEGIGGRLVDGSALEIRRIELGIPRFGADMDENTMPPEAGIESRAISYTKGCYIGQEVISRIKSVGHVNRHLVGLAFAKNTGAVAPGSPLTRESAEIGRVTSCVQIPGKGWLGLGYVKRGISSDAGWLKGDGFEAMVVKNAS